uniref:Pkinase_fungal domain-containing protein n=1 Tax=Bursaphelenchus xylophilus TaxID=6326 RepID=A0A1I7SFC9_BURXY
MFVVPRDAPEFDVSIGKLYTTPHCDEGIRYIIVELRLAKDLRAKGNSNFTVLERKFFYDGSMMNLTMILGDRHEVALRNESEIDSFLTKIKKQSMISHGNTFLCSRLFVQDILLYTITENGFEERVVQCYRRQQLNKDTHIIIQKEGEKLAVKTMSIIEDEPVFRFVQYCHAMCAFGRISNNFFWVFERKKRCFWYQEGPTFAPYLLHSDSQPTRITGYRVQQTLKNEFYLL